MSCSSGDGARLTSEMDGATGPVIVVLGKYWRLDGSDLSLESKLNALAALVLYRRLQPPPVLLFSGGHTAGRDRPAESEAMRTYLLRHDLQVPDGAILLETESIDTAQNADFVARILQGQGVASVDLLTVRAHAAGARRIFAAYGVRVDRVHAAEDVLAMRSSHHLGFIRRYARSPRVLAQWAQEAVRSVLLLVDPRGERLRRVTRLMRR